MHPPSSHRAVHPRRNPCPRPPAPIASPAARRVARELGIDLTAVSGTGPGGRIVEDDVRRVSAEGQAEGEPLSGTRRLMADRLRNWLAATAQFTLTSEVDVTELAHRLVHQPLTAILGAGRARARPAVVDDRVEPRTTLVLSLTVDHQVTDGAPAAAFLADVADLLGHPEHL